MVSVSTVSMGTRPSQHVCHLLLQTWKNAQCWSHKHQNSLVHAEPVWWAVVTFDLQGGRLEDQPVDMAKAASDAQVSECCLQTSVWHLLPSYFPANSAMLTAAQLVHQPQGEIWTPFKCCTFQRLYQAGEKKWGTDESMFNRILCVQSYPQLRACFAEYAKISRRSIEQAIKSEMSGNLELGMLAIGLWIPKVSLTCLSDFGDSQG